MNLRGISGAARKADGRWYASDVTSVDDRYPSIVSGSLNNPVSPTGSA